MTETYSVTIDFGGTAPNTSQFHQEILDSSITTTLTGVTLTGDVVLVIFVSTISGAEKTTLDGLVSSHSPDNTFGQETKGTITVADGTGGLSTLAAGANDQFIIADSTATGGIKYVAPLPSNYVDGLTLIRNTNASIRIEAGTARDSTNTANIVLAITQTANITVSGAGGLDTGTEANSTWYAIHAIDDTSGTNAGDAMLSLSATAPTMPSGYDVFRHVGWVHNDSGGNFLDWEQTGTGRTRRIHYDETFATVRVLNAGQATTLTDVSCSGFAPPDATYLTLTAHFEAGSAGSISDFARITRKGFTTTGPIQIRPGQTSSQVASWVFGMPCDSSQVIQYLVTDGVNNELSIGVVGFEFDI